MPGRRAAGSAAPAPSGHGIGAELRGLRTGRGLGLREAARRLGWSAATLSRTENELRAVDDDQLAALLRVYEVTGPARDRLLSLAREADRPGWWQTAGPTGVSAELATLIGYEARATRLVEVQLVLIPGLLQTPEYTRALMRAAGVRGADIETRVAMRLARQAVLTRPDPLDYIVLLDEAALHRPVGGPPVFARQLRQVAELARRPNVSVQVIPYGYGAHAALTGAHLIIEFADAPTIVHLEHRRAAVFLDRPEDVRPFVAELDTLRFTALDPGRSAELITELAGEHEGEERREDETRHGRRFRDGHTHGEERNVGEDHDEQEHIEHEEHKEHEEHEEHDAHEEHQRPGSPESPEEPENRTGREGEVVHEEHGLEKIRSKWHGNRMRRGEGRGEGGTGGRPA